MAENESIDGATQALHMLRAELEDERAARWRLQAARDAQLERAEKAEADWRTERAARERAEKRIEELTAESIEAHRLLELERAKDGDVWKERALTERAARDQAEKQLAHTEDLLRGFDDTEPRAPAQTAPRTTALLCYEGDCAKMTGRARPCPVHDAQPPLPTREPLPDGWHVDGVKAWQQNGAWRTEVNLSGTGNIGVGFTYAPRDHSMGGSIPVAVLQRLLSTEESSWAEERERLIAAREKAEQRLRRIRALAVTYETGKSVDVLRQIRKVCDE